MLNRNLLIGCLILLCSCTQQSKVVTNYIDTKSFFESQIQLLTKQKTSLYKRLTFGDSTITTTDGKPDWNKELSPFKEIDLNKSNYNGRFNVDTVELNEQHIVTYSMNDAKQDLKTVEFLFDKNFDNILRLKAAYQQKNKLYLSDRELVFYTDSLFHIKGFQKVTLGNTTQYEVIGKMQSQ